MSEKQTWQNLKWAIDKVKGIHYQRIEDALTAGIPDLMLCYQGKVIFVELKQRDAFPKRPATPVRIGFKPAQYLWITKHQKAGGKAVMLSQVGRDYYLHEHCLQHIRDETLSAKEFRNSAVMHSRTTMEIVRYLLEVL